MRSLDFTSQLNNILCPVTILCGKKDTANLKASKQLKELLPQATLHIVPNAGHELNKYCLLYTSLQVGNQIVSVLDVGHGIVHLACSFLGWLRALHFGR